MKKDAYKLYQNGKLIFQGTKEYLSEMTGLSMSTIHNYCRPGYLESKENETKTKVVKVEGKSE